MKFSVQTKARSVMRWLTLIVTIVALSNGQAAAQQADAKVNIDLGTADGPPGRTLSVPMNIAIPEGMKVTEFELTVRFEKDLLSFTKADLAPQGKTDDVKLTTAVEDDPEKKTGSILKITAVAAQPLGSGAVADLFFRINPKAKPPGGSTGHKAAKFTAALKKDARIKMGEGQMLAAGGRDGEIDITQGVAIFGCFFYMH